MVKKQEAKTLKLTQGRINKTRKQYLTGFPFFRSLLFGGSFSLLCSSGIFLLLPFSYTSVFFNFFLFLIRLCTRYFFCNRFLYNKSKIFIPSYFFNLGRFLSIAAVSSSCLSSACPLYPLLLLALFQIILAFLYFGPIFLLLFAFQYFSCLFFSMHYSCYS